MSVTFSPCAFTAADAFTATMSKLDYIKHYPSELIASVDSLLQAGRLAAVVKQKYPTTHTVTNDKQLYDYVNGIKNRYLKKESALAKIIYDGALNPVKGTLGTNTFISKNHGGKLKAKNEIKISTLFRNAPEAFLRMIVVHELAHLREKDHNKAFYQLCCHMEPDYHQYEFDMRLWLICREEGLI